MFRFLGANDEWSSSGLELTRDNSGKFVNQIKGDEGFYEKTGYLSTKLEGKLSPVLIIAPEFHVKITFKYVCVSAHAAMADKCS